MRIAEHGRMVKACEYILLCPKADDGVYGWQTTLGQMGVALGQLAEAMCKAIIMPCNIVSSEEAVPNLSNYSS